MERTIIVYRNNKVVEKKAFVTQKVSIGRDNSNDIVIGETKISRKHLSIQIENNQIIIKDLESSNGSYLIKTNENRTIRLEPLKGYKYQKENIIYLANREYKIKIENVVSSQRTKLSELLERKGTVRIGRSRSNNDIIISNLSVSRAHAIVEKIGDKYFIADNSRNGTFVNGKRIKGKIEIFEHDRITIGSQQLFIKKSSKYIDFAIEASKVEKIYEGENIGLQPMSVKIKKGTFVALMGPSGCGKSTLMKGLNGANPMTRGEIKIHGVLLNQDNFNGLKRSIGYVPQDDIVHKELTVYKTLFFAAKLRLASDVSNDEINKKINTLLHDLNLPGKDIKSKTIGELSGGQRKRISIAVELLNDPSILFLDEPTSPLDPETIGEFLKCIQKLVQRGQTVIMVTHKPGDLAYVDDVLFLSTGGYLCYYGNRENFLNHFGKHDVIEVYSLLKKEEFGQHWNQTWRRDNKVETIEISGQKLKRPKNESKLNQFIWLCMRYFSIKISDPFNISLLIGQPIIIAVLICFIFENLQGGVLFLIAISAVWFGVNNASKEIVSETPIYLRERMFNLEIGNYILSKIVVLSLIASVQVALFLFIISINYSKDDAIAYFADPLTSAFFMLYLSISATIFGLCLSAIFTSTEKVMTVVPIALIPQIMLAGVISSIDKTSQNILSYLTLGRWGTEGFCHIQDDREIGINVQVPDPEGDLIFEKKNAIETLGFYAKVDADWSKALNENVLAILCLNCILIVVLAFALKLKDKKFS